MLDRPDVSLVLEYENAVEVGHERASDVASLLADQARSAPFSVEVLLPDDARLDDELFAPVPVRRFPKPAGAHYYEVKTAGARAASGRVIVFADCDVVAQKGWLEALVRPLDEPEVDVAVGVTLIRPVDTLAAKTFAASTWFSVTPGTARRQLLANNVAVRPEVFLPDGFPDIGCRFRGSCRELDRQWSSAGVNVTIVPEAASLHPAPRHPVRRAVWDGHDQLIEHRGTPFAVAFARVVLHQLVVGSARLVRNRAEVGLTVSQLPVALAYNLRESAARAAGFVLARFGHDLLHRRVEQ